MIILPNSDQVFYASRFAIAAVYIIAVPGDPRTVIVATATDIRRSLSSYVNRYATFFRDAPCDVVWAAWAPKAACGRIVECITKQARGGPVQLALPDAIAAVQSTARRYGVPLRSHDAVLASVQSNVDKVATRVEASRENGTLQEFNREFKRRRLAAQAAGKHFPTYSTMLRRLNHAGMAAVAGAPLNMLRDVFGD